MDSGVSSGEGNRRVGQGENRNNPSEEQQEDLVQQTWLLERVGKLE